ncbi:tandem-95 repeat protein [Allofournierella sp.]|uniref:tandem-95 repeat protein n=1 Tax=Allofournierella sp. TaxID=1940256 RepID=UPI003AB7A36E
MSDKSKAGIPGKEPPLRLAAGEMHVRRRALALVLAVCMAWAALPPPAFSVLAEGQAQPGCTHVHDAGCGYRAPQPETSCDQGCADTDGDGVTDHAEGCAWRPADEGSPCNHVCGPECGAQPGETPQPSQAPSETPGLSPDPTAGAAPSPPASPSPDPTASPLPGPSATPAAGQPSEPPADYAQLTDLSEYFLANRETLDEEDLEGLAAPVFDSFDVQRQGGGLLLTALIGGGEGRQAREHGFVWSFGESVPTLLSNDGQAAFEGGQAGADFEHRLEGREDALVRAYLIFEGYVLYTGPLTADNLAEDGLLRAMSYRGPAGETLVYGQGAPFDLPIIQLPVPWPMGTGFYLQVDRAVDPNETVYLAIKGSIAGVPILDVNGKHIGELQSTVNEEYYIIPMEGRDLNEGKNFVNIVLPPLIPGWFYIDNIQLVFGGGPGELDGRAAAVEQVAFQGYNFTRKTGGYRLAVDGLVRAENDTGTDRRLVTSVNVDGNKMYASQKYVTLGQGRQELATVNKCTDGILTYNEGTLTLAAALVARPPTGSAWAAQEPDGVIVSVRADTIRYEDNDGPNEYRLDFTYDKNYYSPAAAGAPLTVKLTAQSVFGEPVGYICLPKSGAIAEYSHERDKDEGIDYSGQLKKLVLLKPETLLEPAKYGPCTVEADMNRRVYATEAAFDIETNGVYTFAVAGPAVTEYFTLEITNIDSQAPTIELIGASELTLLEDTPYHDLGFGGADNRTAEAKLTLATLLDGEAVDFGADLTMNLAGGEHTVTCIARDQAGNETRAERTLHVKNRPLELVTEPVAKTGTAVTMGGCIRYLGEETVVRRGLVWDVSSAPTLEENLGSSRAAFNVNNKDTFTATAALASLIPNATYYCRAFAQTGSGRVVYGPAQRFEANSKSYGAVGFSAAAAQGAPGGEVSLTVRRTGGADGAQTVRWRTADGSAIAGVHYAAAGGTLNFAQGETSKTVTVRLLPSPETGPHWELENRVFFVELTSVAGGAALDASSSGCTVTVRDNDAGRIQITNMDRWVVASENEPTDYKKYGGAAFGRRDYMYFPSETGYSLDAYRYWAEHGRVQGRQQLVINMKSADSGLYVYVRKGSGGWVERAGKWYDKGNGEKAVQTGALDLTGQDWVMAKGLSQVRVAWSKVEFKNPRLTISFSDTDTPVLKQITALSGDYKANDGIYFTARFSEIVNVTDQAGLYMEVALTDGKKLRADYAAGSGTDVLVFRLAVPEGAESAGVTATLQGAASYVRDLAGKAPASKAGTSLPGVNISSMPYTVTVTPGTGQNARSHQVRIEVEKPAGYAGTGAKYQYVFSTSQVLDGAAMSQLKPFAPGASVTLAGGTGSFWLHVVVQDSLGLYRTQRGPYEISNGVPEFSLSAPGGWTQGPVRVGIAMADPAYLSEKKGELVIYKKDNADGALNAGNFDTAGAEVLDLAQTQEGGFWFETGANGAWALLAQDKKSGETYFSTISVACIDTAAPTAELAKDQVSARVTTDELAGYNYTAADPAVYAWAADGLSGLSAAQYAFVKESEPPQADAAWTGFESGDRLSLSGYLGGAQPGAGSYYLHLKAADKAGNLVVISHPHPFTVPPKTPPTIQVEVRGLAEGLNGAGQPEGAFTPAELTAPAPGRFTARTVTLHVTVTRSEREEPGADLGPVMLPGNQSLWDNGTDRSGETEKPAAEVYAEGVPVRDQNPAEGVIEFDYPAGKNAIYRFVGTDRNGNATERADGTVTITAIDRDAPELTYKKLDAGGAALLPQQWVTGQSGVTLRLSFTDEVSPLYGEGDALTGYTGVGGVEYLVLAGGESEAGREYQPYNSGPVDFTAKENGSFLVKVRDALGNSYSQRIPVTNIDSTPPQVETTNTAYGAGKAPITMQLKFTDREMGLVQVRRFAVLGTTAFPAPDSAVWADYDGGVVSLDKPGTWYVHYYAEDAVGHTAQGCFGPYIIDSGKPSIVIQSRTSDEYAERDGRVEFVYRDDKYARMHSAEVTVEYPAAMTEQQAADAKREYQWSQSVSPSLFGWKEAPAAAMEGNTARFSIEGWGSEGVSGRWYLHLRTKGSTAYRGFLFDNDLPVITLVGDDPAYIPRGEDYTDRGAVATDSQDARVAVTTKVTEGDVTEDTRYIDTTLPGEHLVRYTATDRAGNTATAQRVVYVYDARPPRALGFARTTPEDTALAFTRAGFEAAYQDDANQPVEDGQGGYTQFCSLSGIRIKGLPTHGQLLLGAAPLEAEAFVAADRLDELRYLPAENYYGGDGFAYAALDTGVGERKGNESAPARVTLTVEAVNDAPTAGPLRAAATEDEPLAIDLTGVIGDVEDGTALAVALGGLTARPAATTRVSAEAGRGTATVQGQTIRYTPAKDFNGTVTIPYTVTDSEGAKAQASVTVAIENVNDAPLLSGGLTVREEGADDGLYRGGQPLTVRWAEAVDPDNDPVFYTLELLDEEQRCTLLAEKLEGGQYTLTLPAGLDGGYTLRLTALDGHGAASTALESAPFAADSTPPVIESILPGPAAGGAWENKTEIPLTVTVTDEAHGQPAGAAEPGLEYELAVSADGQSYSSGGWKPLGQERSFAVSAEGLARVRVRATDAAGNRSEISEAGPYRLDRTPPAAFSPAHSLGAVNGEGKTSVTLRGATADDTSARLAVAGLAEAPYSYKLDEGDFTAATGAGEHTFAGLAPNTQHTFTMRAADGAGNLREQTVTCHTRAQSAQTAELTGWNSGSLTVEFAAPENPKDTEYKLWLTTRYGGERLGETDWAAATAHTFTGLAENTEYVLYVQARNGDGVENDPVRFEKDQTGARFKTNQTPILTLNGAGAPRYYRAGETVTFSGTVEDPDLAYHGGANLPRVQVAFSGVEKEAALTAAPVFLGLGQSDTKWNWTVEFTVDAELAAVPDGRYGPAVTAADNRADTAGAQYMRGVWLDRKAPNAPTAEIQNDSPAADPLVFSSSAAVQVKLTAQGDAPTGTAGNENPSGVKALRYQLVGDTAVAGGGQSTGGRFAAVPESGLVRVTAEGRTTLTLEAEDNAGNVSRVTREIYIDRTRPGQPALTATVDNKEYDGSWVNQPVTVTLTAQDAVGVGAVYAKITDNPDALGTDTGAYDSDRTRYFSEKTLEQEVSVNYTLNRQQQNYLHLLLVDTAGNTRTLTAGPYRVDTAAPAPVFEVPQKELTSGNASVVLRGHSAAVQVYDAGNANGNAQAEQTAGLAKAEYVWLPARVTVDAAGSFSVTAHTPGGGLPADDGGDAAGSGIAAYEWQEFTPGASLVQGGRIDGSWKLWVRLTDAAGNTACYNQGYTGSRAGQTAYPDFLFDNEAPNLPQSDDGSVAVNHKTYGTLDLELPVDDENYDGSNSGLAEYQYAFTTSAEAPAAGSLPVFKFESYSGFLNFASSTSLAVNSAAADLRQSTGVTLAAQAVCLPGDGGFHTLLHLKDGAGSTLLRVSVSDVTGAIVLTDSAGADKHLGGGYNDGRAHQIVVAASFTNSVKVFADGQYLGRFWFPDINKNSIESVALGENLRGALFAASLFGRVADDAEGKSFSFCTDDIVGDYVFCNGLAGNVTDNKVVTDRSGQQNAAEVQGNAAWDREYASEQFLSTGSVNTKVDLNPYLDAYTKAKEITVSTSFKTSVSAGYQFLFSSSQGSANRFYIYLCNGRLCVPFYGDGESFQPTRGDTGLDLADGKTHTVTATAKGTTGRVYVDGRLVTTVEIGGWLTQYKPDTGYLCAGYHHDMSDKTSGADRNYFQGTLYNTYIFGRALTQAEVESGNINYVDRPIALLNYTQQGQAQGSLDALPQGGAGMRLDDGGDCLDLGKVADLLGDQNAAGINSTGFSVSVRFEADRARWTGGENRGSGYWYGQDALVGQRLFSMSLADDASDQDAPNMGFGLAGDGSGSLFYYWNGAAVDRGFAPVGESLYQGEHYATLSFDPAADTITFYLDGAQVGQTTGVTGVTGTVYAESHAYAGIMEPPDGVNFPAGAGQFYGTLYNVSVKRAPTGLTEHIQEARQRVTLGAPVAAYNLDEAVNGRVANRGSTGGSALVRGLGDAGLTLDGTNHLEFDVGEDDKFQDVATFEVVYSQPTAKRAALIDQQGNLNGGTTTFRYLTLYHDGTANGYFGYGANGVYAPSAPAGVKTRLTAVDVSGMGYVYRDGVLIASGPLNNRDGKTQNSKFRLGALWNFLQDYCFEGTLYDVKVWATAMGARQVAGLEPYTTDELLVHYDFSGPDPLADKSGRGHDAVLVSNTAGQAVTAGLYPRFDGTAETGGTATGQVLARGTATQKLQVKLSYQLESTKGNPNLFSIPVPGLSELRLEAVGASGLTLWVPTQGQTDNRVAVALPGSDNFARNTLDLTIDYTGKMITGTLNGAPFTISVLALSAAGYAAAGTLQMGSRYSSATENACAGTIYSFSLWENDALRASYGGSKTGKVWTDASGNNLDVTMGSGVSWVPEAGNVTGAFPEFLGTGGSYAATKTGLVDFDSPLTVRMKFKPLEADKSDAYRDGTQNYFSVANDTSAVPFFLLTNSDNKPLYLLTSSAGEGTHKYHSLGPISDAGTYDLELTLNYQNNTYEAAVNGASKTGALEWANPDGKAGTNGQLQIAYRNYQPQNAHMVLYEFEAVQNGAVVCRYDGTRSADGARLIDVSGAGNDASIHGQVNWVTEPFRPGKQATAEAVDKGQGLAWVADQLAAQGDTAIRVSNSAVQGQVYLHVWVRDKLGNEVQRRYGPFDYDTTRPEASLAARRAKQGETATSAYATITAADNWLLDGDKTRWAFRTVAGPAADPTALFAQADTKWEKFEGLGAGSLAAGASAACELPDVGNTASPKKYYLAVEAVDWLGNASADYLYVDSGTLFDDGAAPTITFTPISDENGTLKAHAVQVDVEDAPEPGKTAAGVNGQTLAYAWALGSAAPQDGDWKPFTNHNILRLEAGDGEWTLHVKAADNAGNAAAGSTARRLDNTAPALALARQEQGWRNAAATVNVAVTEEGAGLAALYWARGSHDAGHFAGGAAVEGVQDITGAKAFEAGKLGSYTVYARDAAGNEAVQVYTETQLDFTAPTLALSPAGQDWTKENVTITVTAADLGGAGVASVSYTLNGGQPQTLALTSGKGSLTLTDPGQHILAVTVTDHAGNTATATGVYKIDRAANPIAIGESADTQRAHTVTVRLARTASGPAASARYGWAEKGSTGPEFWTDAELKDGAFAVTRAEGDGEYTLFVTAASATGVPSEAQENFSFDNTPPDLAAALQGGVWAQRDVLRVTAEAGAAVTVKKDGGNFKTGTGAGDTALEFAITENGAYTVTAADGAGNTAEAEVRVRTIDTTDPTAALAPAGSEAWRAGALTVAAVAGDGESGVAKVEYAVTKDGAAVDTTQAGSGVTVGENGVTLAASGEYTVTATVTDGADNAVTTAAATYRLDLDAPTLAPEIAQVTADSLTVNAKAQDEGGSGLGRITGSLGDGSVEGQSGSVAFAGLAANRAYAPTLTAQDAAGNRATAQAAETYTLAAPPTGFASLRATTTGLRAELAPGKNAVAPRYLYTLTLKKETGPDEVLYESAELTRSAVLEVSYREALPADAALTLTVTAVNEDGTQSAPVSFAIGGGGTGAAPLNAPPTVAFEAPAANVLLGAGGSVEFRGNWDDANGDAVTVTLALGGREFPAKVEGETWSVTVQAADLREGTYQPQDVLAIAMDPQGERAEARPGENFALTVDKTPPRAPAITLMGGAGWQRENGFALAAAAGDTDLEKMEYSLDGGQTWNTYPGGEVPVKGLTGEVALQARAADKAGNLSPAAEAALLLDGAAPIIAADPTAQENWASGPLEIALAFADETSLAAAGWLVNESPQAPGEAELRTAMTRAPADAGGKQAEATVRLTEDGAWYIHTLARDGAGTAARTFGPYQLDGTAPKLPAVTVKQAGQTSLTLAGAENAADAGGAGLDEGTVKYHWQSLEGEGTGESEDGNLQKLAANARYRLWLAGADGAGNRAQGPAAEACTLAADPKNVELAARGGGALTFRITGDEANAVLPEYKIALKNAQGAVLAESGWGVATTVRLALPENETAVYAFLTTRNQAGAENPEKQLTADAYPDGGFGGEGALAGGRAPTLTLDLPEARAVTGVLGAGDTITITGTAADPDGDALYVAATLDNVEKTVRLDAGTAAGAPWTLSWSVSEDKLCAGGFGEFGKVTVTAMDPDDNRAQATDPRTWSIDNAGPEAPATLEAVPAQVRPENGGYTLRFAAGADRGAAGVAGWAYTLDGGAEQTGQGDTLPVITVTGEGAHTLTACYIDALGNRGDEMRLAFALDGTPPTLDSQALYTFDDTLAEGWNKTETAPGAGAWFSARLRADFAFGDGAVSWAVTGSDARPAQLAPAQGRTVQAELGEGAHWVHLLAVDGAGNEAYHCFGPYQVDLAPIPVSVAADGTAAARSHTARVTVSARGDASGLAKAEYLWSAEPAYSERLAGWQGFEPGEEPFETSLGGESGVWYLYARVTDRAGNRSVGRSDPLTLDNTPPEILLEDADPGNARRRTVRFAARDAHSPVTVRAYKAGSHAPAEFAGSPGEPPGELVELTENGVYTFYARDEAGNEAVREYTTAGLDAGAPTIEAEGPAGVWNTEPFAVTVRFADPEGNLARVGYVDPQYYDTPAEGDGMPDATHAEALKTLPDLAALLDAEATEIDERYFHTVDAADLQGGALTVQVGGGSGSLCYAGNGSLMLHFAAQDKAGNLTVRSFGPYRLDDTPPTLEIDAADGAIRSAVVPPGEAGQENFTGFSIADNLTNAFAYYPADSAPAPEEGGGAYTLHYDPAALGGFTTEGLYRNAVRFVIADAAGNTAEYTVDCLVADTLPPQYGDDSKTAGGDAYGNYITAATREDTPYTFAGADFTPQEGPNALFETSLPLRHITLRALPAQGSLALGGVRITAAELPKTIGFGDIQAGKLTYAPNPDWNGTDTAMAFTACDGAGNETEDLSDPTRVLLHVEPVNDPPVLKGSFADATITDLQTYTLDFEVTDPDSPEAALVVEAASSGAAGCAVVRRAGGGWRLSVTPAAGNSQETVTLTARDGQAAGEPKSFALTVMAAEKPYAARPDSAAADPATGTAEVEVLANDRPACPARRVLGVAVTTQPAHGRVEALGEPGAFRYTEAQPGAGREDSFTYTVQLEGNVEGDLLTATVLLNDATPPVIQASQAPQADWASQGLLQVTVTDAGGVGLVAVTDPAGNLIAQAGPGGGKLELEVPVSASGRYTIAARDLAGNETEAGAEVEKIDSEPPRVDLGGAGQEDGKITGIQIADGGSGDVTVEVKEPSGAQITQKPDGSYEVALPPGADPGDVVIAVKDGAGNETEYRFDDLTPPELAVRGAKPGDVYYLPVTVDFADYKDAAGTLPGEVVQITGGGTVNPPLPKARGEVLLPAVTAPYVSGGENRTVYPLAAVDAAGNRTLRSITMKHIPAPGSVTSENRAEIEEILKEVQEELDRTRPGIDLPQEQLDQLAGLVDEVQKEIEEQKRRDEQPAGPGGPGEPPASPAPTPGGPPTASPAASGAPGPTDAQKALDEALDLLDRLQKGEVSPEWAPDLEANRERLEELWELCEQLSDEQKAALTEEQRAGLLAYLKGYLKLLGKDPALAEALLAAAQPTPAPTEAPGPQPAPTPTPPPAARQPEPQKPLALADLALALAAVALALLALAKRRRRAATCGCTVAALALLCFTQGLGGVVTADRWTPAQALLFAAACLAFFAKKQKRDP